MPTVEKPAISVIIPTRDRPEMLCEALDSVAAQTFRDYEVIVVDDGSIEPVADAISGHPSKPRVIRHAVSRGPAAARNRGVREAAADTVAFLDSDDLWLPDKLARFHAELDRSKNQILYGPMHPIDERGNRVPGRTKPCHKGWITERLFCSSFVHVPTVVCRKSILIKSGGFDESLPVCEDYDLWLRISLSEPFGLVEEPLAERRLHPSRLSKACMSRNLNVKARVLQRFAEQANGQLDLDVANRRLARACYVASRAAFWDGRFRLSREMYCASRNYGATWVRTLPIGWASRALVHFENEASDPEPAVAAGPASS